MALNLTQKIILAHLVEGGAGKGGGGLPLPGTPVSIRIDQTLTQDATGTLAYLQFETLMLDRVKTELSVSYIDHNTLQGDYKNADDHRYLQSVAARYGLWFSPAGNGICHQVHLENFGLPGKTLLGSDSHTPTGGALGMLAIGAGGLDIAVAMGGGPFSLVMPKVYGVRIRGSLRGAASAKDIILEILRRETVKGGVGAVYEYFGEGVATLSVTQRATITNMGAELGATSSIFPVDERTKEFLRQHPRKASRGGEGPASTDLAVFDKFKADDGADYDRIIEIDLSAIEPLAACPHSPDNVKKISEIAGLAVDQVAIGSCTNSSLEDLENARQFIKGRTVHPRVSAGIVMGSRDTFLAACEAGIVQDFVRAGFRVLECACGPCIGMGFAPKSQGVSLRTFNRNFKGRSGTKDAEIYLVSPETAAASAIAGKVRIGQRVVEKTPLGNGGVAGVSSGGEPSLADARSARNAAEGVAGNAAGIVGEGHAVGVAGVWGCKTPNWGFGGIETPLTSPSLLIPPLPPGNNTAIERGPNIKPCPLPPAACDSLDLTLIFKAGDNITTDDIMPAGAKVLPYRSNIPKISKFVFYALCPDFYQRAHNAGGGNGVSLIAGGVNYGQGSSREHAAIAPMYLGVRAVIAKSFARIHKANLINFGILPFVFGAPEDYEKLVEGEIVHFTGILDFLKSRRETLDVDAGAGKITLKLEVSPKEREELLAGGTIPYLKRRHLTLNK